MVKTKPVSNPDMEAMSPASDDLLRQFVGYSMKRAFMIFQDDMGRTLSPVGLRMMTFSTLALVVGNPGISQTTLARKLHIERSGVVVLVDELETRELIERRRVKGDRRSYALHATRKGRALWQDAQTRVQAHEASLLDHLSAPERAEFHARLETISKRTPVD